MMVDLNEKELFSLMKLVHMDFLDKRDNKHVDVTFEEGLEKKLVGALLMETGHVRQITDSDRLTALRMIEEHRLLEEQK